MDHDLGRPRVQIEHLFAAHELVSVHLTLNGRHAASTSRF